MIEAAVIPLTREAIEQAIGDRDLVISLLRKEAQNLRDRADGLGDAYRKEQAKNFFGDFENRIKLDVVRAHELGRMEGAEVASREHQRQRHDLESLVVLYRAQAATLRRELEDLKRQAALLPNDKEIKRLKDANARLRKGNAELRGEVKALATIKPSKVRLPLTVDDIYRSSDAETASILASSEYEKQQIKQLLQ